MKVLSPASLLLLFPPPKKTPSCFHLITQTLTHQFPSNLRTHLANLLGWLSDCVSTFPNNYNLAVIQNLVSNKVLPPRCRSRQSNLRRGYWLFGATLQVMEKPSISGPSLLCSVSITLLNLTKPI